MEVARLAQGEYRDYNDSHFTVELGERHEIQVAESKHDRQIAERKQYYTPARRWSICPGSQSIFDIGQQAAPIDNVL